MAGIMTEDSIKPFSLHQYHVSEEYGFILPSPLTELPPYYQPWMDIAQNLPELLHFNQLRSSIHQMPQLDTSFLQSHKEQRLAHLALGMMTMGYVWQEGEHGTVKVLPQNLAVPYWEVSQRLGLPPILSHADSVLANWKKKDPEGPIDMENLELIITLPGGKSAHGFFMVTLLVELAAVQGIKVIPVVVNGVRDGDVERVTKALEDISQALCDMTEALKLMNVYVDPAIFYGTMRIFLSGWKDNPSMVDGLVYEGVGLESMEFSGGSAAQSSLLHSFDELLGIKHEGSSGAFLLRMRDYMPPAHHRLISDISSGPSLRRFVQKRGGSTPQLETAYQRCLSQLVVLRNYHITVVSRFITVPAACARRLRHQGKAEADGDDEALCKAPSALEERGTGGSGIMSFLKTVRNRTQKASLPSQEHN